MSPNPRERLYGNLPSFYRMRDADEGEPLRALLGIVDGELATVQTNLEELYNDLFIETCAEWVAPYLGELVGADRLKSAVPGGDNGRAYIANAIAYRRRKGTLGSISSLARDLTGWSAHPVEFYQFVGLTQPINHLRPANLRTPRLRNRASLHNIGTPFDRTARTIDFKRGSKASLDGIGIFLWRLTSFPLTKVCAARAPGEMGCYHFDPLGIDAPLFNPLRTTGTGALTETSAPGPIAPGPLADALAALRAADSLGIENTADPYLGAAPPFQITINETQVLLKNMRVADLSDWRKSAGAWEPKVKAVVDPTLGRFMIPLSLEKSVPSTDPRVVVSFYRGFASELGGGFYDRSITLDDVPLPIKVSSQNILTTALVNVSGGTQKTIIEIADSLDYIPVDLVVPAGMTVELRAANKQRPLLKQGTGTWNVTLNQDATLVLNGLLIEANLNVTTPGSANLSLEHCTVVPGRTIHAGTASVTLSRSIIGQILVNTAKGALTAKDCIIDGQGAQAIEAGCVSLTCCTVFGTTKATELVANDCIFTGEVTVPKKGTESLVSSFKPGGSDLAANLCPAFTSKSYGQPGYAQLRQSCPKEIREEGSDQSEMGAFHHLYQKRRLDNLQEGLKDYLRYGLKTTLFFVT